MRMKGISVLMILLLALVATTAAGAVPVNIDEVEVDDDEVEENATNVRVVDRSNSIDVDVKLSATADVEDVQVEAVLRGHDSNELIEDITSVFDMEANRTHLKGLNLDLPSNLDKDEYRLRVRVEDRNGDTTQKDYELDINNKRHDLQIKDVIFSPHGEVTGGRALLTTARLENYGTVLQDSVKLTAEIPELGIAAADYIDEIEEDESLSSEELYMRIPECVEPGTYDVNIGLEYHNGEEIETVTETIDVVESEVCEDDTEDDKKPKTVIAVGSETQSVKVGEGAVYPLTITNEGDSSRTYVLETTGYEDWADVRVSPENIVVLDGGETKALYVYATPKEDAQLGEHMFNVAVESDNEVLEEFSMTADVKEAEKTQDSMDIKNVLLIGLVVLVVLLVILGLIIGFGKLRGNDKDMDEDTESGETYY